MITSLLLVLPHGALPPALPWLAELTYDNANAARWCRVSNDVYGDGVWFDGEIYGLAVKDRDVAGIIAEFRSMELAGDGEAMLFVKRDESAAKTETYTIGGSPMLRAMRARARGLSS
jgi:hypothetical protein